METKKRILKISTELFYKQGLKMVSMDQIAQELGISKRTLYEKYKDKDAIILDVLENMFDTYISMMRRVDAEHPDNSIVALISIFMEGRELRNAICPAFFENLKKYYHEIFTQYFLVKNEELHEVLGSIFFKCQQQGFLKEDLDLQFVLKFLKDMGEDKLGYLQNNNYTIEHIRKYIFRPYLIGICSEKAIETLKKYFKDDKNKSNNADV